MFIPINAKADVEGSKKGKLTPAQNAQLNAWCLSSKTGILDCLDRCEAISTSFSASNNIATIVFKKGYIVICGRLVECEDGTEVNVTTPASGNVNGRIILRYSLSSAKEQEFVVTTTSNVLTQQDLNENPLTGIYEFELYSYVATPTSVTLTRNGEYVPDIGGKLAQFEASLKDEGKPLHGYDDTKGTIEERLTALGFKEGAVILPSGVTASVNKLKRQGNYVVGEVVFNDNFTLQAGTTHLFDLPVGFRPKENITFGDSYGMYGAREYTISTNGRAQVAVSNVAYRKLHLNFGFEAPPIIN